MANQYGTNAWAKREVVRLSVVLALLKEPNKQWDKYTTHLQAAIKSLSLIQSELEEVINA